jgi:hypothetical protein
LHVNGTALGSPLTSAVAEDRIEFPAASPGHATEATAAASPFPPKRPHWTALERVGFRIAFLYFFCFLFLFGNGTLFAVFPVVGDWINNKLSWPFNTLSEWTGQHVFHLSGLAAHWNLTHSGDSALNWILNGLFVLFALAGGLLWTAVAALRGNRRTEYRTLYAWLRFLLRLTLAMFMCLYGLGKLFPLQMQPLSIAILNEPVGHLSPMTFLWGLIGLNPVYESICGAAEILGGVLLLFRPTALAGSLFSAFVVTNVVLYNFCFDVPVKLFAANLLLAALFLALPDLPALFRFFVRHTPARPTATWVPPLARRSGRIAILVVEILFAAVFMVYWPIQFGQMWHHRQVQVRTPSPLLGAWHLDPAHPANGAFIDPESKPITDLYVDPSGSNFTRSGDGALWRTGVHLDAKKHTVTLRCYVGAPTTYTWQLPDANHLILTSIAPEAPKPGAQQKPGTKPAPPFVPAVLTLTRTPTPSHYPLLERGFHFVNQWGLER